MKELEYIPKIIRASLDHDERALRLLSVNLMRRIKNENPEIAKPLGEKNDEKSIDILELKNKGYINFEPKSQSKGDKFEIKIKVNKDEKTDNVIEELFVLSKGEVFYPKGINSPFSE